MPAATSVPTFTTPSAKLVGGVVGSGEGATLSLGSGCGDEDGGSADGVTEGVTDAEGDGDGVWEGVTDGEGEGLADTVALGDGEDSGAGSVTAETQIRMSTTSTVIPSAISNHTHHGVPPSSGSMIGTASASGATPPGSLTCASS